MNSFITILLIGLSLSMDAFSLSLAYGITIKKRPHKLLLSFIIGLYHFIMPLIGFLLSNIIDNINIINIDIIAFIILLLVGINLIISKEENNYNVNILSYLLFGLSVSLDSFSIGIGLKAITDKLLLSPIIFSIISFTFTLIGLYLGNTIKEKDNSKVYGGITLIIISVIILLKNIIFK